MGNVNMTAKAEGQPTELALQVIERLKRMRGNKAEIAIRYNCSRAMVSQYLNGKYQSNPEKIEGILRQFLADSEAEYGDSAAGTAEGDYPPEHERAEGEGNRRVAGTQREHSEDAEEEGLSVYPERIGGIDRDAGRNNTCT